MKIDIPTLLPVIDSQVQLTEISSNKLDINNLEKNSNKVSKKDKTNTTTKAKLSILSEKKNNELKIVKKRKVSKRGENEDSEVRYDLKKGTRKVLQSNDDNNAEISGNEDDKGSVVSAILEEDICFICGLTTMLDTGEWDNVLLCDKCDGEYHTRCCYKHGLDKVPEESFVCYKCIEDETFYKSLDFNIPNLFLIPKEISMKTSKVTVYSPSRPIELAWEECKQKGLMIVSNIFPKDIMSKLTHGTVEKIMKSGRVSDQWKGATIEISRRMSSTTYHDIIDRNGRYDIKLPDFVVEELQLETYLNPILSKLINIMGIPKPKLRTHNIVFVPVGSGVQEWHVDDSMIQKKLHRYFTILIHLNPLDSYCGGTEIWLDKIKKGDLIRARPGDALVFHGSLLHRGHANYGSTHRYFYYCSFACSIDLNTGNES